MFSMYDNVFWVMTNFRTKRKQSTFVLFTILLSHFGSAIATIRSHTVCALKHSRRKDCCIHTHAEHTHRQWGGGVQRAPSTSRLENEEVRDSHVGSRESQERVSNGASQQRASSPAAERRGGPPGVKAYERKSTRKRVVNVRVCVRTIHSTREPSCVCLLAPSTRTIV